MNAGDQRTAAERAAAQVAAVRDSPQARLGLLAETYRGPTGRAPDHLPFRRAALSFMAILTGEPSLMRSPTFRVAIETAGSGR